MTARAVEARVATEAATNTTLEGARAKKKDWVRAAKIVHQSLSEILRYIMATT